MKAIVQTNPDDPRSLQWRDAPTPVPGEGEVLVKVAAAGVNRADLVQAQGRYPAPKGEPETLGLEIAGTIVDGPRAGQPVGALLAGGGYAEYVAVPEGQLTDVPEGFDAVATAAVVEAAVTVWSNLVMVGGLTAGETVLIHGGAGGIGTMAIQVAKALGATVAVTAGSDEKLATCRDLGADILINYHSENFLDRLRDSCDLILDVVGADYLDDNMRCLRVGGRLVVIAVQSGPKATVNLARMMPRRQSIHATTLRSRPRAEKARIVAETVANVWPMLADGRVRPLVHATVPMAEAARAHDLLDSGEVTGKIVLTV
ncbi:NAD(P)H-quinone oxidoreductase [Corynebacterium uterequi]|uniref:Putative NAD(P)H quinone oxidoreductase, PIG3 family n=1 Tax=Corynebacterium uterequi TaxID=1072256 RepID=A0A0G3HG92_9CORY|nr:NAD(P)H-quinone oxidoreductase [Corynebacterium uterequi]AKK10127.1 putative NAD(P)H quinone oxidoreductase, PIG3 family [Corynebacterium uterequi]